MKIYIVLLDESVKVADLKRSMRYVEKFYLGLSCEVIIPG